MRVEATPLYTIAAASVSALTLALALVFNFAQPVAHNNTGASSPINFIFALVTIILGVAGSLGLMMRARKRGEKGSTFISVTSIVSCMSIFGVSIFLQSYGQDADHRMAALAASWGRTGGVTAVMVQSDGKIVIAGGGVGRFLADGLPDPDFKRVSRYSGPGTPPPLGTSPGEAVLLVQLDSGNLLVMDHQRIGSVRKDGSDDPAFHPYAPPDGAWALAKQSDGRVLVASIFDSSRRRIIRMMPNGAKDASFRAAVGPEQVRSIVVQPDGKILVAGWLSSLTDTWNARLVRLLPDGSLDPDFEIDKVAGEQPALASAKAFVLLRDGSSVISWQDSHSAFVVAHFDKAGRRVPRSTIADSLEDLPLTALAIDPDGGLIAGSYGISRVTPSGERDRDFSGPANGSWKIREIRMQGDKILVVDTDGKLTRLNANGEIDLNFQTPTFQVYTE